MPHVTLAAESLLPGNGGICRVARLMARVLLEEIADGRLTAQSLVLGDKEPATDLLGPLAGQTTPAMPTRFCSNSRPAFVLGAALRAPRSTHYLYDTLGMNRAHDFVLFPPRPFLVFVHGIEVWEAGRHARLKFVPRAGMVLSNTAYTRERARSLHPRIFDKAKICWLSTEEDAPPAVAPAPDRPPCVLIIGRMDELRYKGHRELIEAWPKVLSAVPSARLVVVGRGPAVDYYRKLARSHSVEPFVDFKGFVPDDRIDAVWNQATVFAMPSRGEGFGLVYIEAMRRSIPVVASIHDAAPEINLDGVTGYNVDLDQPDQLPDRIIRLLRDPDHARALGNNGQDRWRTHFRFSSFRDRFKPLLREFLK